MYRTNVRTGRGALGAANWQDQFMTGLQRGMSEANPDLAQAVQLAAEIVAVERQPGGALDPNTPSTFQIADLHLPLKAYLFYRKHPLLIYSIPIGILLAAFLLGRATARR
jgi:hypothetical protein